MRSFAFRRYGVYLVPMGNHPSFESGSRLAARREDHA